MAEPRPRAPRAERAAPPTGAADRADEPSPAETPTESAAPLCQVALCPICTTVMLLGDVQPELMGHLLAAGREMLLAMRTIIDLRLQEPASPPKTIQRLTII